MSVRRFFGTGREKALRDFAKFFLEVLPFLYAQADSPRGTKRPARILFTTANCCLLGVSRNFLYNRKGMRNADSATIDDLTSLVDTAGLRLRQHRRNGDRRSYILCYSNCNNSSAVVTFHVIRMFRRWLWSVSTKDSSNFPSN